jgi:Golgi apparatus protein 1
VCAPEDRQASESGLVYKCLVAHADEVDASCRRELGRALHMAFFVWIPGSILTSPCDVDIAQVCLKERPNMLHQTGQIAQCLADGVRRCPAGAPPGGS